MLDSLIERLRSAIEDGEVLTVVYSGGHDPGAKRRILPIRIAEHLLYARAIPSMAIKTYRLDSISVVADDYPASWASETAASRQRATRVDPVDYFASWVYRIEKALWPALGVTLREYVDKEKSAALRSSSPDRRGTGALPAVKFMAYAVGNPPELDFHEGDLFFPSSTELPAIQVVAKRKLVEVHAIDEQPNGSRTAYQIVDEELAEWLQSGLVPRHARIDAAQSYSEVLRFSIQSD